MGTPPPTSPPDRNYFGILAAPSDGARHEGGEDEPDEEEKGKRAQEESNDAAPPGCVDDGATTGGGDVEAHWSALDTGQQQNSSSLVEDLLAAPNAHSTLPANHPVRVETAAYFKKCMLDGTTPASWALQMVLPPGRVRAGPTEPQVQRIRGDTPRSHLSSKIYGLCFCMRSNR